MSFIKAALGSAVKDLIFWALHTVLAIRADIKRGPTPGVSAKCLFEITINGPLFIVTISYLL